jgi:acyl dehydratase
VKTNTDPMRVGDVIRWQRTFSEEDIRAFAKLSGDEGEHHLRTRGDPERRHKEIGTGRGLMQMYADRKRLNSKG